jgi:hypothetical protein
MPSDAVGVSTVIAVEPGGGKVISNAGQEEWSVVSPSGLPAGVVDIDFVDESTGWALVASSECTSFKSNCATSSQLFKTTDGGQTWSLSPG